MIRFGKITIVELRSKVGLLLGSESEFMDKV